MVEMNAFMYVNSFPVIQRCFSDSYWTVNGRVCLAVSFITHIEDIDKKEVSLVKMWDIFTKGG